MQKHAGNYRHTYTHTHIPRPPITSEVIGGLAHTHIHINAHNHRCKEMSLMKYTH